MSSHRAPLWRGHEKTSSHTIPSVNSYAASRGLCQRTSLMATDKMSEGQYSHIAGGLLTRHWTYVASLASGLRRRHPGEGPDSGKESHSQMIRLNVYSTVTRHSSPLLQADRVRRRQAARGREMMVVARVKLRVASWRKFESAHKHVGKRKKHYGRSARYPPLGQELVGLTHSSLLKALGPLGRVHGT